MAGGGGENSRELDQTPTWAVASVCAVIIVISIILEKGLHRLGEWFTSRHKTALFEALEKVKSELMVLGFISLLLTFGQNYIIRICIPEKAADTMLPCRLKQVKKEINTEEDNHRRLLKEASSVPSCPAGKVPLISLNGLHQLHIFIFFLAVFHVIYSAVIMALGRAKIRRWKEWEKDTSSPEYQFSYDPSRFRFTHQTSFVRQHTGFWHKIPCALYIVSFFRQFFQSVRKTDYWALRHGFISVHVSPGSKFDFKKYIKRSLEDDFKVVVGISPVLWASAVLFLLLNVKGWQTLFWISIIPIVITLAVGTKLQAIIEEMALEIKERHAVVQGLPLVQLCDERFWFGRPQFVLFLIHFTLFQNAFQIMYFIWIWYEFGLESCFHENLKLIVVRVCLGVGILFLCSYITLPLYALVSQMGSQMKKSIFDEQTSKALKRWHDAVKKRKPGSSTPSPSRSAAGTAAGGGSTMSSPVHPAHHQVKSLSLTYSRRRHLPDNDPEEEHPEVPLSSSIQRLTGSVEQQQQVVEDNRDFSFVQIRDA